MCELQEAPTTTNAEVTADQEAVATEDAEQTDSVMADAASDAPAQVSQAADQHGSVISVKPQHGFENKASKLMCC